MRSLGFDWFLHFELIGIGAGLWGEPACRLIQVVGGVDFRGVTGLWFLSPCWILVVLLFFLFSQLLEASCILCLCASSSIFRVNNGNLSLCDISNNSHVSSFCCISQLLLPFSSTFKNPCDYNCITQDNLLNSLFKANSFNSICKVPCKVIWVPGIEC